MLVPFDPFKNLDSFFEDDDLSSLISSPRVHKMARMNIQEQDENIVVEMEVPGVKSEDIDISIEDNILRVRAGSEEEKEEEEEEKYHRREFKRHYFERVARLPADVKADEAKASYSDGVLTLTVPKEEEEKKREVKVEISE